MSPRANPTRMPAYYVPHGGGPCFFMEWPGDPHAWDTLAGFLRAIPGELQAKPRAIVVVSAHWEAGVPTVTAAPEPALIYDYSGFPPSTYALKYPAPGEPVLAARIQTLLEGAGIAARADAGRGFDHGVFVPLLLVAPDADIPIVQLSLVRGLDPAAHFAIGQALAPLRDEGILIVGSGMSFHNMSAFLGPEKAHGDAFDAWLGESIAADPSSRRDRLAQWQNAPQARLAHPREEHLLPLMVVAGAAESDSGRTVFHDRILGTPISAYRFG
jgi:aromatic ring-opening dioxygenase catalytic subunit (LigB family)